MFRIFSSWRANSAWSITAVRWWIEHFCIRLMPAFFLEWAGLRTDLGPIWITVMGASQVVESFSEDSGYCLLQKAEEPADGHA